MQLISTSWLIAMVAATQNYRPIPAVSRVRSFYWWASLKILTSWARRLSATVVEWPLGGDLNVDSDVEVCDVLQDNRRTPFQCQMIPDRKTALLSCWRCRAILLRALSMAMRIQSQIPVPAALAVSNRWSQSVVYTRTRRWANQATPAPCRSQSTNPPFRW